MEKSLNLLRYSFMHQEHCDEMIAKVKGVEYEGVECPIRKRLIIKKKNL